MRILASATERAYQAEINHRVAAQRNTEPVFSLLVLGPRLAYIFGIDPHMAVEVNHEAAH
jgi:hypothetical protein